MFTAFRKYTETISCRLVDNLPSCHGIHPLYDRGKIQDTRHCSDMLKYLKYILNTTHLKKSTYGHVSHGNSSISNTRSNIYFTYVFSRSGKHSQYRIIRFCLCNPYFFPYKLHNFTISFFNESTNIYYRFS